VGRFTEELTPDGAMQYEYDAAGLRTAMKLVNQGDLEWSVSYQYDRANRLQSVTDSAGSVTTLRFAPTGELAELFHPFGVTETITTDPVSNRVTGRSYYSASAGSIKNFGYSYDAVGNITAANLQRYIYDANNRLTAVKLYDSSGTSTTTEAYTYDAAGNRLTSGIGNAETTYEYAPGGLLQRSVGKDGKATLYPNGTSVYYTYNSRGLLTKTQEGTKFTYNQYDVDGRRIARRVTTAGSGGAETPSESVRFQYDGIQVVATRDAANGLKMAYARMPGGQLVSWYAPGLENAPHPAGRAFENRGIFILDHLGSVLSLRDSIGEVNGYTYDAFGNPTSQTGNAPNELKFTGAPMDSNGPVHLSARFYKPSVGRLITQDTWKGSPWQPWTQNLYTYVGNNPVNYVDPTGHVPNWAQVVRGAVKALDGFFEAAGGVALAAAAFASAPSIVGAIALGTAAAFMISDGVMTMADGIGDVVDAFTEGDTVPTLNMYDVWAAEGGDTGQGILMAARTATALYDVGGWVKILNSATGTVTKLAWQTLNVAADGAALEFMALDVADDYDNDAIEPNTPD
jgi:RHS repeat-associated protein